MADPVQHLNDECMLLILEFAGASEEEDAAPLEPDFFDAVQSAQEDPKQPPIWSATKAARFYYPLALVNQGWNSLLARLLSQHAISVDTKEIRGNEEAAMKWVSKHNLSIRSLDARALMEEKSSESVRILRHFSAWLETCDTSRATTAHIYVGSDHLTNVPEEIREENLQFQKTLSTQCPKLQSLRIQATYRLFNLMFAGSEDGDDPKLRDLNPCILCLPTIQSVDLMLKGAGPSFATYENFFPKFLANWTSLRNLRLEWRQKKDAGDASPVIKLESPTLEKLSLERFSPYLHTRFDLSGCPNLQEYTLGKLRRRTKQSVVGSVPNDASCGRVSRLARRARIARRAGYELPPLVHRALMDSSDEDAGPPALRGGRNQPPRRPMVNNPHHDSSDDESDGPGGHGRPNPPPLRMRPPAVNIDNGITHGRVHGMPVLVHPMAAAAAPADQDESDSDDSGPPGLATHDILDQDESESDDSFPPALGAHDFGDVDTSSEEESSDSLEDDDSENADDSDGGMPNLVRLRI